MTGLRLNEWADLCTDLLPRVHAAEPHRLTRPTRQRAVGAGRHAVIHPRDHILLTVVWLRHYPTNDVLGFLFGVSDRTAARIIARVLPLLEAAGRDTMRMPDPGRKRRKELPTLLADTPELAVLLDTFAQRVQRPRDQDAQRAYDSGKKKTHTRKSQGAVNEETGDVCDVAARVPGPQSDRKTVEQSDILARIPAGIAAGGDLASIGMTKLTEQVPIMTRRRKPRGKDRPLEDIAFNQAVARRRISVEHTIGRLRRCQALTQTDRHHRQHHTPRVRAVAGLVNRQIRARLPCEPYMGKGHFRLSYNSECYLISLRQFWDY